MTQYLEYPTAQGPETFTANGGDNTLTLNGSSVNILYDVLTNTKGVSLSGTGFSYNNGTTTSSVTWNDLKSMVDRLASVSASSNSTTLNVTNKVIVTNGTNTLTLSSENNIRKILIGTNAGTSGQFLTSGGTGNLNWTTYTPSSSSIHASTEIVTSTTATNVTSSLDVNNPSGVVFFASNTGRPSARTYFLPAVTKAGYICQIRNNGGELWNISISDSQTGAFNGTTSKTTTVNSGGSLVVKYLGNIDVTGNGSTNVWIT